MLGSCEQHNFDRYYYTNVSTGTNIVVTRCQNLMYSCTLSVGKPGCVQINICIAYVHSNTESKT